MTIFRFELNRFRHYGVAIGLITIGVQLTALYFFALVGRFDGNNGDQFLQHYSAVLGLASTTTLCVIVIYTTILTSRHLVRHYVGLNQQQTYLLPVDRKGLLMTKLTVIGLTVGISNLIGLIVADAIFLVTMLIMPLVNDSLAVFYSHFMSTLIGTVGLTLTLIGIACCTGLYLRTIVGTVVTGVILVVIFSNVVALVLIGAPLTTILTTLIGVGLTATYVVRIGNVIEHRELTS